MELVNVSMDSMAQIALFRHVFMKMEKNAMVMVSVSISNACAKISGQDLLVTNNIVNMIATIMVIAKMEFVSVMDTGLVNNVTRLLVLIIVIPMVFVNLTEPVNA